jgi:signal transduction histidine kinase
MNRQLTTLCREECLRLIEKLKTSERPFLLLHTLKANVHALGLTQLARQIHSAEERQLKMNELPLKNWRAEIERLSPLERGWDETLQRLAQELGKKIQLDWIGPQLPEINSLLLHLTRNSIAHCTLAEVHLRIVVKERRETWFIQVQDNAGGLKAHDRAADLMAGRGAGLDYVRETLKSWGGQLSLTSTPGVGLTVTMEFSKNLASAA